MSPHGRSEVARRPEVVTPELGSDLGEVAFAQQTRRDALQGFTSVATESLAGTTRAGGYDHPLRRIGATPAEFAMTEANDDADDRGPGR